MARTRTTPNPGDVVDGNGDTPQGEWRMPVAPNGAPQPDDEDTEQSPLEALIATLQGSAVDRSSVKLYRKTPNNPRGEWCSEYSVPAFMDGGPEMIRNEWGPGSYVVMVYGPHPVSGKVSRLAYQPLDIAPKMTANHVAVVAPAPAPSTSPELLAMLKALSDGQQALAAALANRPDPTAELQRTLGLMTAMRDAMGLNVAPAPPPPAVNPSSLLGDLVGAMKMLKDVSNEFGNNAPDPDSPSALLGNIVDVVKTVAANPAALGALTGQPTAPTPVQPLALPSSVANASQPAEADNAPQGGETIEQMVLKGFVQKLCKMAADKADPKVGGEFIADSIPDEFLSYLKLPNWFDIVTRFAPELVPHRAWVEQAKVHAEALLSQDSDD